MNISFRDVLVKAIYPAIVMLLVVGTFGTIIYGFKYDFTSAIEKYLTDIRFEIKNRRNKVTTESLNSDIMIITIEEETQKKEKLGTYPWPRNIYANFLRYFYHNEQDLIDISKEAIERDGTARYPMHFSILNTNVMFKEEGIGPHAIFFDLFFDFHRNPEIFRQRYNTPNVMNNPNYPNMQILPPMYSLFKEHFTAQAKEELESRAMNQAVEQANDITARIENIENRISGLNLRLNSDEIDKEEVIAQFADIKRNILNEIDDLDNYVNNYDVGLDFQDSTADITESEIPGDEWENATEEEKQKYFDILTKMYYLADEAMMNEIRGLSDNGTQIFIDYLATIGAGGLKGAGIPIEEQIKRWHGDVVNGNQEQGLSAFQIPVDIEADDGRDMPLINYISSPLSDILSSVQGVGSAMVEPEKGDAKIRKMPLVFRALIPSSVAVNCIDEFATDYPKYKTAYDTIIEPSFLHYFFPEEYFFTIDSISSYEVYNATLDIDTKQDFAVLNPDTVDELYVEQLVINEDSCGFIYQDWDTSNPQVSATVKSIPEYAFLATIDTAIFLSYLGINPGDYFEEVVDPDTGEKTTRVNVVLGKGFYVYNARLPIKEKVSEYTPYTHPERDTATSYISDVFPINELKYLKTVGYKEIPKFFIPIDENGKLLINYMGPHATFENESFYIYSKEQDQFTANWETIKNRLLMLGFYTSAGLGEGKDYHETPMGTMYGIEIHANALYTIINQNYINLPPWWVDFLIMLAFAMILTALVPRSSIFFNFSLMVVLLTTFILINIFFIFPAFQTLINISNPIIVTFTMFLILLAYKLLFEEREGRRVKGMFSSYVNKEVVDELMKNPDKLQLGGEDKNLTVMFSDIRSFTTLSEGLTPQELVSHLNIYLSEMTHVIFEYKGTLDKYVGDEIMAFWGAPVEMPEHAINACYAALDSMRKLELLNENWPENKRLKIGIGINTGIMTVGNMGSEVRKDYTLMGDNVNLGARLEGVNKMYSTNIIISEFTYEVVKDHFIVRELDLIRVKGKKKPVKIYELLGPKEGDWNYINQFSPLK